MPIFTPPGPNQIYSPGTEGGANYGPLSYSPRTGLLYVNAVEVRSVPVVPPEDISPRSIRAPASSRGSRHSTVGARRGRSSPPAVSSSSAPAATSPVIFFAYDAKTGAPLWKFNTGGGVFSSPAVYMVNGEEFVTVASGGGERGRRGGDLILSFAIPKSR